MKCNIDYVYPGIAEPFLDAPVEKITQEGFLWRRGEKTYHVCRRMKAYTLDGTPTHYFARIAIPEKYVTAVKYRQ